MRATVERIASAAAGDGLLLTLRIACASGERVHTYRIDPEQYEEVGAPAVGDELRTEELRPIIAEEEKKRAYERALKILACADNTRAALERKLCERGFDREYARAAVERVVEEGYLCEKEMLLRQFAVFAKRLWGAGKYMPSLLAKGFSREAIEEARALAAQEGIYDAETVREELLSRYAPNGRAEERALLYKHGFH